MLDYLQELKHFPTTDTKRKFWPSHVFVLKSVKDVLVKRFLNSSLYCEYFRCYEAIRDSLIHVHDEFSVLNVAHQNDFRVLFVGFLCFICHHQCACVSKHFFNMFLNFWYFSSSFDVICGGFFKKEEEQNEIEIDNFSYHHVYNIWLPFDKTFQALNHMCIMQI